MVGDSYTLWQQLTIENSNTGNWEHKQFTVVFMSGNWPLNLQQPVVSKSCHTPDPTSKAYSVAKSMHITQRGDKLKILQKAHRASSQWHTKTHRTEYLESLACDHSLIGWKLWHHKGRREQNHLLSCTHRATQVSFLSGSTFKTQRCHKWLQIGWKKIEG